MKSSTFGRIGYFVFAFSLLAWLLFWPRQPHVPPMTQALEACVEACNNDTSGPHRVKAGDETEVIVICDCQGYGHYEGYPGE